MINCFTYAHGGIEEGESRASNCGGELLCSSYDYVGGLDAVGRGCSGFSGAKDMGIVQGRPVKCLSIEIGFDLRKCITNGGV